MKILIPVEDVFFGSAIVNFLSQHQWPQDVEFRVLNVVEPFLLDQSSHIAYSQFLESSKEQILAASRLLVKEVADEISNAFPKTTVSREVITGPVKEEILAAARHWPADLIIAGSHGRGGFNNILLGSVSLALTSKAPCSVLLIKPDAATLSAWNKMNYDTTADRSLTSVLSNSANVPPMRKILIAVDETTLSQQIVDFIGKHTWAQPAQFRILSAVKQPYWYKMFHTPEANRAYRELIHCREAAVRNLSLRLVDQFHCDNIEEKIIEGDPKLTIVEIAKQWQADLIIVGCHTKTGSQKFVQGSVSQSILNTAACSVVLLKNQASFMTEDDSAQKELLKAQN